MIELYCDIRWEGLIAAVKEHVSSFDEANLDGSRERCKTTWECYADLRWQNAPFLFMLETEIVDPACEQVCLTLSEFELTALLARKWDEFLDGNNPRCEHPWEMELSYRRKALTGLLQEAVHQAAGSDGAEIEDRMNFSSDNDE